MHWLRSGLWGVKLPDRRCMQLINGPEQGWKRRQLPLHKRRHCWRDRGGVHVYIMQHRIRRCQLPDCRCMQLFNGPEQGWD